MEKITPLITQFITSVNVAVMTDLCYIYPIIFKKEAGCGNTRSPEASLSYPNMYAFGSTTCMFIPTRLCSVCAAAVTSLLWLSFEQLVTACNDGARRMERTEQMYTIQKQMDFGKIKVGADQNRLKEKYNKFLKQHYVFFLP